MQKCGVVKSWNPRGYGLISVNVGEVYFLHVRNIVEGPEVVPPGSIVHFNVAPAYNNGVFPQAIDARIVLPSSDGRSAR